MAKSQIDAPVWFVTGCSSGFGREFVRSALAHRFRVVATARDPKKLDDIIAGHKGNAIALPLDVTNAEEIKYAVSEAERVFGRIDVLINNAGYGYLAAVEEGEEQGHSRHVRDKLLRSRRHGPCGSAGNVGTAAWMYHQCRFRRRDRRLCGVGLLRGHEIRG
jgi:NAD(P)-dependent dehydrogenase (short-subunit alcohol dehydrogenase family)